MGYNQNIIMCKVRYLVSLKRRFQMTLMVLQQNLSMYILKLRNNALISPKKKVNNIKEIQEIKQKNNSNSIKEISNFESDKLLLSHQTFCKNKANLCFKSSFEKKESDYKKKLNNDRDKEYLKTEDLSSNFYNYQKLCKFTMKQNNDDTINIERNNSIVDNLSNKKNSLNMSFLNQFTNKAHSEISVMKKGLNITSDKKISSFSFQFANPLVKSQSVNRKISYEIKETNLQLDENTLKNLLLSSSGKVLNLELINRILNEFPEIINKKSLISTKEDTLKIVKATNYQTRTIDVDSIENLHFIFIKFIKKSKQIMSDKEKIKKELKKTKESEKNVDQVEEVDIE